MARLFEQSQVTTPDVTERLATGKAATPTSNITIANFVTWLQNVALSFLKPNSNLSDLLDKKDARRNLSVYSRSELDGYLDDKADKSNVLELDNEASYTPTMNYHPVTRKFHTDDIYATRGEVVLSAYIKPSGSVFHINKSSFISGLSTGRGMYDMGISSSGMPITVTNPYSSYSVLITVNKEIDKEANFASYRFVRSGSTWAIEVSIRGANGNLYLDPFNIEIKKWS